MLRHLYLACGLVLLATAAQAQTDGAARARAALQRGDYSAAANAWEKAAAADPASPQAPEYRLSAAEAALRGGDDSRAERLLSRIPVASLDALQQLRGNLLRAEIGLTRGQPRAALLALPASSDPTPALAPRIEALRARALFGEGDAIGAVRTLVKRERYLSGAQALADNRDSIWAGLIATPLPDDARRRMTAEDEVTRGWLDLALQLQEGTRDFGTWLKRHPGHPATPRLADVGEASAKHANAAVVSAPVFPGSPSKAEAASVTPLPAAGLAVPPAASASPSAAAPLLPPLPQLSGTGGYALLLPRSGPLAGAAEAIRDGFVASELSSSGGTSVRIYDAGISPADTLAAYQNALRDGAAMVIGPLTKEGVAAIAAQGSPAVPVLALNYLENSLAPAGLLQLGLAPEDEARSAADQAWADGHRLAASLVPDSDWGRRVQSAFERRFVEHGGQLADPARYPSGSMDFSKPLRSLMGLDNSEARHRALTGVLGENSEFEPRRRDDLKALFLGAKAAEAGMLLPQLRFYRAGGIALYAPSSIYDGRAGSDLDGLRFCDMPWMLDSTLSESARELFPDTLRRNPRFYALGLEAYRAAEKMRHGEGPQLATPLDGPIGRLSLEPDGRFRRELGCAEIRDGTVQSVVVR